MYKAPLVTQLSTKGFSDMADSRAETFGPLNFMLARSGKRFSPAMNTLAAISYMNKWDPSLSERKRGIDFPENATENEPGEIELRIETPYTTDTLRIETKISLDKDRYTKRLNIVRSTIKNAVFDGDQRSVLRIRRGDWRDIPDWDRKGFTSEFLDESGSPIPIYTGRQRAKQATELLDRHIQSWAFYRIPDLRSEIKFSDENSLDNLNGLSTDFTNLSYWLASLAKSDPDALSHISEIFRHYAPRFGKFRFFSPQRIEWTNEPGIYAVAQTPTNTELQILCLCVALNIPEPKTPGLIGIDGLDMRFGSRDIAAMTSMMRSVSEKTQVFIGYDMRH